MAYLVNVTPRVERDLAHLYHEINAGESDAALKWYLGLKKAILKLEQYPNRCPATPENPNLRHLLYGNKPHIYRVIYRVLEKQKTRGCAPHPAWRTAEIQPGLMVSVLALGTVAEQEKVFCLPRSGDISRSAGRAATPDDCARNPATATSPEICRRSHAPANPFHCCIVREFAVSSEIARRDTHFNNFVFFSSVEVASGSLWEVCE